MGACLGAALPVGSPYPSASSFAYWGKPVGLLIFDRFGGLLLIRPRLLWWDDRSATVLSIVRLSAVTSTGRGYHLLRSVCAAVTSSRQPTVTSYRIMHGMWQAGRLRG